MAPPTAASASQPLSVRVQTLVQHPQFAWWVGHVVLLISAIRYGFSVISFTTASSQFYYRTAFVGAVLTYGVVIYKTHSAVRLNLSRVCLNSLSNCFFPESAATVCRQSSVDACIHGRECAVSR